MRKLLIFVTAILLGATAFAQPPNGGEPDSKKDKNDKIRALSIAYITEELDMSSREAEEFWPVYNKIKEDHRALEMQKREILKSLGDSFDTLKEKQAQDYVNQLIQIEVQLNATSLEMKHQDLIDIIGAKRFLMLKKAEMDFRRKMIREYKERRRNANKD
jgi:hypothetical protein